MPQAAVALLQVQRHRVVNLVAESCAPFRCSAEHVAPIEGNGVLVVDVVAVRAVDRQLDGQVGEGPLVVAGRVLAARLGAGR